MQKLIFSITFLLIFCGTGCSKNAEHHKQLEETRENSSEENETARIDEQLGQILLNFWKDVNFKDSINQENIEQKFSNFAYLLSQVTDTAIVNSAVENLLDQASVNERSFQNIQKISAHYLYDPNSPMLNEETFIPFMKNFSISPFLDDFMREKYSFYLEMAFKNRKGTKITDFKYTDRDGKETSLWETPGKELILLMFYDPDCDNCKDIIEKMKSNRKLNQEVENNRLSVIAIYSGEDKNLWTVTKDELPAQWTVGFEPGTLEDNDIYFFRAMPTFYLLDANKTILAKDVAPAYILNE